MIKRRQLIVALGIALTVAACTASRPHARRGASSPADTLAAYYHDSLSAVYNYTEGIKQSFIYSNYPAAVRRFEAVLSADSMFAPAYFEIANILVQSDPAAAIPYSRKAVDLDTTNLSYRSQLGEVLVRAGNYDEALNIYGRLLREDPHNLGNYRMLAALYDYNKQPFTAISILDSAEHRLGRMEELSSYKRHLLMTVGLYDKALDETKALIADYPYEVENYRILGSLYGMMGKDSLARETFREAMVIDSTDVPTLITIAEYRKIKNDSPGYLNIVNRLFESDDLSADKKVMMFDEVTSNMEFYRNNYYPINNLALTLMRKHPGDFGVVRTYAVHLTRSGELEQALNIYKSYLSIHPDQIEAYYAVIDIESYQMRPDSVAKYADMALKRFPDSIELYLSNGFALLSMGNNTDALKAYKTAYRLADTDSLRSVITGTIGDMYYAEGKARECYRQYDKALRLFPDNSMVLNNYAYFLSEENRSLEKSLRMSKRSNELSPSNPTYLDTYAWILYKLGRYEEAKSPMLQAVSLDRSGSTVLLVHYGDILYELGENFMARTYWRRALEKGHDPAEIEERFKLPEKK